MGITQDRLIKLLTAAENSLNACHQILATARHLSEEHDEFWFKEFAKREVADFLPNAMETAEAIASERERIRLTKYHNDMRRRRYHAGDEKKAEEAQKDDGPDYAKLLGLDD